MSSASESVWWHTLTHSQQQELLSSPESSFIASPDLLVLGGDLAGLATAYFAAERGLRVQILVETPDLAVDAQANLGCIIPNACAWQFAEATQPFAQASRDWWAKLAVRPEFQIDWRVCGALMVDQRRLIPSARQHMLAGLEAGYSLHDVDAEQIALLEPALAPCPAGGLHYPSEAFLHPLRAACGFIKGLRRTGVQITCGTVSGVQMSAGKLTAITSTAGDIHPRALFTADSSFLRRLVHDDGTSSLLTEVRRTYLASTPLPALLKRPILHSSWIVQPKSGEVVVEVPESAATSGNSSAAIETTLASARALVPALSQVEFPRVWHGVSQRARDGLPVIDKSACAENLWYCGGLDFESVLFVPIIGKSVADWILSGQPADELAPFKRGLR